MVEIAFNNRSTRMKSFIPSGSKSMHNKPTVKLIDFVGFGKKLFLIATFKALVYVIIKLSS